jgi:hypothetical protein
VIFDAVRLSVDPSQTSPPFPAVSGGLELTVTVVVDAVLTHPFSVAITEYVPLAASVVFGIDGFCNVEVKPFGPVQL